VSPEAGAARQGWGDLRTRTLSAVVLAAVAIAAGVAGGLAFALLAAVFAAVAFWEWTAITGAREPAAGRALAAAALIAGALALGLGMRAGGALLIALACGVGLLAGLRRREALWMGLGVAYVGVPAAGLVLVREAEPSGAAALMFILAVVWATDIGAYFGGRALGGPKLWPRVSPKKTWSGALAGLAAGAAAGLATVAATGSGSLSAALFIGVALSIAAQAGDLFESAVKRRFGVKDSGAIIPGHGGVLDRVDGLFGAAALALPIAAAGLGGGVLSIDRLP
jgi:phosphatidate cytidylyltransferase